MTDSAEPYFAKFAASVRYDKTTGNLFWTAHRITGLIGTKVGLANPKQGYVVVTIGPYKRLLHRLIWRLHYGYWPEGIIDHANGVTTDNRIENLRSTDGSGNNQNSRRGKRNKSGYLGVSAERGKWRATIKFNGKQFYRGVFDTPEAAHQAYLTAKRELHSFNPIPRDGYND